MKVLDAATLHEGIDQTLREIKDIQSKLSEIQRSVQGSISLEDHLKGKMGEGIRSFYRTIHEPFLIFLYQSLIDYSLVLESAREAVQSYEPDENGLVRQDFIERDVVRGLNRLEDTAADMIAKVNREISDISDLVALPRLDIEEFSYVAQTGRKRLTETVGQLSQLDDSQTRKLAGVEKDQGVMKQYMREMSRTFSHNDHMIPSFSLSTVLNLPTFPTIWKSIYGDSAAEKEEKKEDHFLVKGLKVTGNSIKGAGLGLFDFGKDTVVEVYETVKDPAGAVESIVYAAKHPVETYQYIEKSIVDSYERDMINGNAESRAHWVTYALGTTATAVVGTKGTGALTKSGIATTRAGTVKVIDSAKNLDLAAWLSYSYKYQLSLADNVPYNVVNGNTLKKNLLMKVEGKGTGTGNPNHPIRTYRNTDFKKSEEKYTADPRITVEMPYVGKGKPGTNAEGWLRDKDLYWKEIIKKHPESLSKANKQKINLGFSPINDKTFREHFPQYDIKELNNDKLIHHHVGGGGQAVAVPSKLHPGTGGIHNAEKAAGVWGNDSEYAELLEKFINK